MSLDTSVADEDLAALLKFGTSTAYEASGLNCALDAAVRPLWRRCRVAGRALPVRCHPADNLPLHLAMQEARPGDVLVVDGAGELCGYWGEVLTLAAQERGIVGLVIDGGVRDVEQIEDLGFPVFARGVSVRRTGKHFAGSVGATIAVAGVNVRRGDAVIADSDGVIVVPAEAATATLLASARRADNETEYMRRLRAGELTVDIMRLRRE
jgi:4-hydroxy-4-methyl-2-oxoglutarate aldolase